jgi:hypothetical protein
MTSFGKPENIEHAITAMQQFSRRDFLKFAAASVGVASVGMIGIALPFDASAAVPNGIRFMGEADYKVFHRLMQVSLPVGGTPLASLEKIPVMQTLDAALLAGMAPHVLSGLKQGVGMFEQGAVKLYGKPFSQLGDKEATAFCDAWDDSSDPLQRGLATGLKKLVALAYWANPPTWAALGYDGPVSKSWGLESLGNAPMPAN